MIKYRFEIVRGSFGRYSWQFVELDGGRRRVLARSGRDYGSRKRAREAIIQLKELVPDRLKHGQIS